MLTKLSYPFTQTFQTLLTWLSYLFRVTIQHLTRGQVFFNQGNMLQKCLLLVQMELSYLNLVSITNGGFFQAVCYQHMINFKPKFLSLYCMGNELILYGFQIQNNIFPGYLIMHALKFSPKSYINFNFNASYLESIISYYYLFSRILLNSIFRSDLCYFGIFQTQRGVPSI